MTIFCRQRFAFLPQMLIASFCFSILIDGFVGTGPVTRNQLHLKGQEWGKKKNKSIVIIIPLPSDLIRVFP